MVTIAASRVWAFSTLRGLSWMVHVLLVGTWPSRSCVIDSAMSNLAESLCLCRDPAFVPAPGAPLHPVESEVIWGLRSGLPKRSPSPLKRSAAGGVAVGTGWDLCRAGYTTRFLRCSPWRPDVDRCIGGWALSLRGWRLGCVAPFGCVVALSEPDPEMTAMLSRAAENVGSCGILHRVPILRGWTSGFGGGRAGSQRPPPVPFFPEVHEELTRSWKAPFTARNKSCGSSALTTLDGGAALGTRASPRWSGLWPCNCVQQPLPPCGVIRVSPHGPVSIRQA